MTQRDINRVIGFKKNKQSVYILEEKIRDNVIPR